MAARRALIALAAAVGGYTAFVRPRLIRWGATDEEVSGPYPGADIVPGGNRIATMAATLDAPPSEVWPWLVQMGCDRGGWYSWDRLDNSGEPSSETLHPEWQDIEPGQRMMSTKNGRTWFVVAAVEPERFLALRASYDGTGHPFDPEGPRPKHFTDSVWCFQLTELPGERARVVVSGYAIGRPRWFQAMQDFLFWEPAHWIMQTRQFASLQRRVQQRDGAGAGEPGFVPPARPMSAIGG